MQQHERARGLSTFDLDPDGVVLIPQIAGRIPLRHRRLRVALESVARERIRYDCGLARRERVLEAPPGVLRLLAGEPRRLPRGAVVDRDVDLGDVVLARPGEAGDRDLAGAATTRRRPAA